MVCKNCKRAIDDDSIFCKWCGERQIRERKKKEPVDVGGFPALARKNILNYEIEKLRAFPARSFFRFSKPP